MADVHSVRKRVRHTPDDVYALVADVRDYPNFLKWVKAMRVRREALTEAGGDLLAEAVVGWRFVRERFATTVRLDRAARAIDVAFAEGPFTALDNRWRFTPLTDGSTQVDFWIRFQFRNPMLHALARANLGRAASTLIGSFEARAAERFPFVGDARATLESLQSAEGAAPTA